MGISLKWRVPGAPSKKKEGLKVWSQKDIDWSCKLGKNDADDEKVLQYLRNKDITAIKTKVAEGHYYNFGTNWVSYWNGERKKLRNPKDGDFFVVFTDGTFVIIGDYQFSRLIDLIRIRKIDEKMAKVANPFGMADSDRRKVFTPGEPYNESQPDPNEGD